MDNNILSTLLSLLSGNNSSQNSATPQQNPNQNQQNPAFFGYPKEAYSQATHPPQINGLNLESLLPLLTGNKETSILSNLTGKNAPFASIASLLGNNKKEEDTPLPNKEILL